MSGKRVLWKRKSKAELAAAAQKLHEHTARPKEALGLDYPTTAVGKSTWLGQDGQPVTVLYDPSLGAGGLSVAQSVLSQIDAVMAWCDSVLGVRGKGGNVVVAALGGATDGSGGAYHYSCAFNSDSAGGSDWYCDYDSNPQVVLGLAVAEIVESYMGLQGKGWNCGGSGGEGLSRYLAEIASGGPNGALSAYASGPSWDGSDWIDKDEGTDQDYPSIGCSVLYLWWMTHLGHTPAQIAQAGEPEGVLAGNYNLLTGKPFAQAFADFKAAVAAVGTINGDDPWNSPLPAGPGAPQPAPPPVPPTPPPAPAPTPVLEKLVFNKAIPANKKVSFVTPVTIPAGTYALVQVSSDTYVVATEVQKK